MIVLLIDLLERAGVEVKLARHCQLDPCFQDWHKTVVSGLSDDSRLIAPGLIFIATPQGRPYLASALKKQASVILLDHKLKADPKVCQLLEQAPPTLVLFCEQLLRAQGELAAAFYGQPTYKAQIVGVTGTNGKTSICWFLYQLWKRMGYAAGFIGTLGAYWHTEQREFQQKTGYTTPRSWQLQKIVAEMVGQKVKRIALEVSSEGLDLGRLYGVHFHTAVFTGLSQDHLDYHKNIEAYYQAKKKLFELCCKAKGRLIIPRQDTFCERLAQEMHAYPKLKRIEQPIDLPDSNLPQFHAWNLGLAWEAAGLDPTKKQKARSMLTELSLPPGRFEIIIRDPADPVYGIVDYAHTPDALEKLLITLRKQAAFLVCVFGCGGNRDTAKRPLMGAVASRFSDLVLICDDNPRQEDPVAIRREIRKGLLSGCEWEEQRDRRAAIYRAVERAWAVSQGSAVVVVAGKGHEDYQIFKEKTIAFSDRVVLREALEKYRVPNPTTP